MKKIKFLTLGLVFCFMIGGVSLLATGCGESTLELTFHDAVAATCEESGNIAYYEDEETGKFYQDENGETELSWSDIEINATGHSLTHVDAIAATCTTDGTLEHYVCSVCGKTYSDAEGTNALTSVTVEMLGHDYGTAQYYEEGGVYTDSPAGYYKICNNDPSHYESQETEVTAIATATALEEELSKVSTESDSETQSVTLVLTADLEMSTSCASVSKSATIDLNGHTITFAGLKNSAAAFYVAGENSILTIEDSLGGGVITSNQYGVMASDGGTCVITGGNFVTQHSCLSSNNTNGAANFVISGGSFSTWSGAPSIYYPTQTNITITGGTFNSGVVVRMGQINISGGTFYSFNPNSERFTALVEAGYCSSYSSYAYDSFAQYYNYSGNVFYGNAFVAYVGAYSFNDDEFSNSLNLNITGGTFINDNNDEAEGTTANNTIQIFVAAKVEQDSTINITGGEFSSTHGTCLSLLNANSTMGTYANDGTGTVTETNTVEVNVAEGLLTLEVA